MAFSSKLLPKYLASHGIVIIGTAVVIAAVSLFIAREGIESYSKSMTRTVLRQAATILDERLSTFQINLVSEFTSFAIYEDLKRFAADLSSMPSLRLNRELADLVNFNRLIRHIVLFDLSGAFVAANESVADDEAQVSAARIRDIERYWGRAIWDRTENGDIRFSKLLFDPVTSNALGIAVCTIDTKLFDDLVPREVKDLPGTYRFLALPSNQLIYQTELARRPDDQSVFHEDFDRLPEMFEIGGRAYFGTEALTSSGNWRIQNIVAAEDLYGLSDRTTQYLVAAAAVVLIVSFVLVFFVVRAEVRKITRIVGQTREIADGHFKTQVPLSTRDELGELSHSVASMAGELDRLVDGIAEERTEKTKAELKALEFELSSLRARMNPHLVSNVLEYINSLSKIHSIPRIGEVACGLGDLLRAAIRRRDEMIPLADEISYCESFLRIHELLRDSGLVFRSDLDPDCARIPVPSLILQPIVENCIVHGLDPKPGPGRVLISAQRIDDTLSVSIEDNGVGINGSAIVAAPPGIDDRIGLWSVQTRLHLLYGNGAELRIENAADGGTKVTVDIPCTPGAGAWKN